MVNLNILFYTDLHFPDQRDHEFTLDPPNPLQSPKGLSLLRDLIEKNVPKSAKAKVHLINRNRTESGASSPGASKLTADLLAKYDEVWFFGYYEQDVKDGTAFDPSVGGPENELRKDELDALAKWMDKGGVLIAGDHSNPVSPHLNLGRALGQNILRAGQMRTWQGGPTTEPPSNHNTHSPGEKLNDLDDPNLQDDAEPQHIQLFVDEEGDKLPHKLFQGEHGIINVLPDHKHEGELVIPKAEGKDWPKDKDGRPVEPFFVAFGSDSRFTFGHFYELVTVYDGHKASVGRIVAASTWHHYTNINLRRLPGGPNPRAPLNLIGEYYGNLAWWLAPETKRNLIMCEMLDSLATHPEVLEEVGAGIVAAGRAAESALRSEGQSARIEEVVETFFREGLLPYKTPVLHTLILGAFVEVYHSLIREPAFRDQFKRNDSTIYRKLVRDSFTLALENHLREMKKQSQRYRAILSSLKSLRGES